MFIITKIAKFVNMILVGMRLDDSPAVLRRRFAALRPGLRGVERRLRTATPDLPFPVYPRRPSRAGRGQRCLSLARRCFGRFPARAFAGFRMRIDDALCTAALLLNIGRRTAKPSAGHARPLIMQD